MTKRNGDSATRVLVCAVSAVRRAGLEALVKGDSSLMLAGTMENAVTLMEHAAQLAADVILIDADGSSNNAISDSVHPPIVALIDEASANWAADALRNGVKAILPRDADADEIVRSIHMAARGLVVLDPEVAMALSQRVPSSSPELSDPAEDLTPRELEVLQMLAEGLGNRQMASRLGISEHTVKFHISSIFDKLSASSRTEAVTLGIRAGLILL